ncbi:MAG: hypothetical protein AAF620_00710 [Bacteroidota bacterium]
MNNFSDKEYQNLRNDTAEVRACITRYIGYIISAAGFSGALRIFFGNNIGSFEAQFALMIVTLIIITLLFEVIWYKFASHNRFVGYIQLLMQELDAIPIRTKVRDENGDSSIKRYLTDEQLKDKEYIKRYQDFLDDKPDKGIEDFYSWDFVISRLHSIFYSNKKEEEREKSILQSIKNSRFVFSISPQLYPFIEVSDKDQSFFKEILFPLYIRQKSKKFIPNIFKYFRFLYSTKAKILLDDISIEDRYVANGWRYPKKITQIAYTVILVIFVYISYSISQEYPFIGFKEVFTAEIWKTDIEPIAYFLVALAFVVFWTLRYVKNLKDLIYGKCSIDFYCWMFFLYRTQLLYNRGIIPVFFSRAFVRYFKSKLYSRILEANKLRLLNVLPDIASKKLDDYQNALNSNKDFDEELRKIHCVVKEAFKSQIEVLSQHPEDLSISDDVLRCKVELQYSNNH